TTQLETPDPRSHSRAKSAFQLKAVEFEVVTGWLLKQVLVEVGEHARDDISAKLQAPVHVSHRKKTEEQKKAAAQKPTDGESNSDEQSSVVTVQQSRGEESNPPAFVQPVAQESNPAHALDDALKSSVAVNEVAAKTAHGVSMSARSAPTI